MAQVFISPYSGQMSPGAQAAFEYDSLWFWQSEKKGYPSMEEAQARGLFPQTFLHTTKDKRYIFAVVNGVVHRSRPGPTRVQRMISYFQGPGWSWIIGLLRFLLGAVAAVVLFPALGSWYILYEIVIKMVMVTFFFALGVICFGLCMFLYDVFWSIMLGIARIVICGGVVVCVIFCILTGGWSKASLYRWTKWAAPAFTGISYPAWITRLKKTFTTSPI
ncbi:hypothetical protein BKA65DRAFT_573650 [Rhexocercosporidium sp. MPI-PUGE-AT-0058]|nr:hypothetical protein BKA65DRAFT_573650 [Rhexocercosporidium sp. MPI-PUGE-AT-0058]